MSCGESDSKIIQFKFISDPQTGFVKGEMNSDRYSSINSLHTVSLWMFYIGMAPLTLKMCELWRIWYSPSQIQIYFRPPDRFCKRGKWIRIGISLLTYCTLCPCECSIWRWRLFLKNVWVVENLILRLSNSNSFQTTRQVL